MVSLRRRLLAAMMNNQESPVDNSTWITMECQPDGISSTNYGITFKVSPIYPVLGIVGAIWKDLDGNIYFSQGTIQSYFDETEQVWKNKKWNGLTSFNGNNVWDDGTNVYYSYNADQYVLDTATSTWSPKTWSGFTSFSGSQIWKNHQEIFYSSTSNPRGNYKLSGSTWTQVTFTNLTSLDGSDVWQFAGLPIYSYESTQYFYNGNNTWMSMNISGLTSFNGRNVFYDHTGKPFVQDAEYEMWTPTSLYAWTKITLSNNPKLPMNTSYVWSSGTTDYYAYLGCAYTWSYSNLTFTELTSWYTGGTMVCKNKSTGVSTTVNFSFGYDSNLSSGKQILLDIGTTASTQKYDVRIDYNGIHRGLWITGFSYQVTVNNQKVTEYNNCVNSITGQNNIEIGSLYYSE